MQHAKEFARPRPLPSRDQFLGLNARVQPARSAPPQPTMHAPPPRPMPAPPASTNFAGSIPASRGADRPPAPGGFAPHTPDVATTRRGMPPGSVAQRGPDSQAANPMAYRTPTTTVQRSRSAPSPTPPAPAGGDDDPFADPATLAFIELAERRLTSQAPAAAPPSSALHALASPPNASSPHPRALWAESTTRADARGAAAASASAGVAPAAAPSYASAAVSSAAFSAVLAALGAVGVVVRPEQREAAERRLGLHAPWLEGIPQRHSPSVAPGPVPGARAAPLRDWPGESQARESFARGDPASYGGGADSGRAGFGASGSGGGGDGGTGVYDYGGGTSGSWGQDSPSQPRDSGSDERLRAYERVQAPELHAPAVALHDAFQPGQAAATPHGPASADPPVATAHLLTPATGGHTLDASVRVLNYDWAGPQSDRSPQARARTVAVREQLKALFGHNEFRGAQEFAVRVRCGRRRQWRRRQDWAASISRIHIDPPTPRARRDSRSPARGPRRPRLTVATCL